jgi:chromosome partitioning protein
MSHTIAVMNAKGGVGKSTLVLAIAETLSAYHGKRVLVIDSDSQASVSSMLMPIPELHRLQGAERTLVDYLVATVLLDEAASWQDIIVEGVSDVDDAHTVSVVPSDMQLTLFERAVSKQDLHTMLRKAIKELLAQAREGYDIVLIDCPPGISVLTESWLREADYHVSPTKADYVSVCGLEVLRRFKTLNPEMGFADNLGVIVNMRDTAALSESEYDEWLRTNPDNRCFTQAIPRVGALQDAVRFQNHERSYLAKYPGRVGEAVRGLTVELVERLEADRARRPVERSAAQAVAAAVSASDAA